MRMFRQGLVLCGVGALTMAAFAAVAPKAAPKESSGCGATTTTARSSCPTGVTSLTVEAWGASGGDGGECTINDCVAVGGDGGEGAYVTVTLAVTPGETLHVVVGEEGGSGTDVIGGEGGDGYGEGGDGGIGGSDGGASASGRRRRRRIGGDPR